MASRRLRLKAVINLPVRRGRDSEQLVSSNTNRNEVDLSEEENDKKQPETCDDSIILNNTSESAVGSSSKPAIEESNPAHEKTRQKLPSQNEISSGPSNNSQSSKIVARKRLKPAVNLSILSRRTKEHVSDTQVDTVSNGCNVISASSIGGNTRLPSKPTDSSTTVQTNEESDGEICDPSTPSCSKSETRTSNESRPKFKTPHGKFEFAKPSPRLVESSSKRSRIVSSVGTEDQPKPSTSGSTLESQDFLESSNSPTMQSAEKSPSVREQSVPSSAASSCSSRYDDVIESDVENSKAEKRTSHRRVRKNGMAEQLSKARRDFHSKFGSKTPDKTMLTMFDLIFYNPVSNPMKITEMVDDKRLKGVLKPDDAIVDRLAEESVDDIMEIEEDANTAIPAPQVKVGPDGSLIIDEKSLVIETTGSKKRKDELANSTVVMDSGMGNTTYNSFSKRVRAVTWSNEETFKFYRALNSMGTDFLLMQSVFPNRSRRDLKQKFKKEDRLNRDLIDKALRNPLSFDFSSFERELEQEQQAEKENEKKKSGKKKMKVPSACGYLVKDLEPEDAGKIQVKRKRGRQIKKELSLSIDQKEKSNATLKSKIVKKAKITIQHVSSPSTTDESECYISSDEDLIVEDVEPSELPPDTRLSNAANDSVTVEHLTIDKYCKTFECPVIPIDPEVALDTAISVGPAVAIDTVTIDPDNAADTGATIHSVVHILAASDVEIDADVTIAPDIAIDCDVATASDVVGDAEVAAGSLTVQSPPRQVPRGTLSTADDIDLSSSDDEERFLKTTRQTRYGRIPQRRVLSSSSSSDESEEEDPLRESERISPSPCSGMDGLLEQSQHFVPDLNHVEPGSLVIFTTPGQNSYQLFMVGPQNSDATGTHRARIPVSATPEILESISSNTKFEVNSSSSPGEDKNVLKVETLTDSYDRLLPEQDILGL